MGLIGHYWGYFIPTDVGKTMSKTTHYKHTTYKNGDDRGMVQWHCFTHILGDSFPIRMKNHHLQLLINYKCPIFNIYLGNLLTIFL
jgi:hypothetical protein